MAAEATSRRKPNVLVTGTPGTGKSSTCSEIASRTGFEHVDVGAVAKDGQLYSGFDADLECPILDDDRVRTNARLIGINDRLIAEHPR